ncbi:MAG: hypothetical protein GX548_07450 [Lentisphaerae bacterium]|nr:hypothetical protein [Lentisphaerota bacterium]
MHSLAPAPPILWPVQPVWQLDPAHPIPESERRTCCAVATTLMMLNHFLPAQGVPRSFLHVRNGLLRAGGKNSQGHWQHSAQVAFFATFGLVAWRRNWAAPSQNPQWLADHEGYSPAQLAALRDQTASESPLSAAERPWSCLRRSLASIGPVIASVMPGFTTNRQNHQIVLLGFRSDGPSTVLAFLDPLAHPRLHPFESDLPRFLAHFNRRAIFVLPPDASDRSPESHTCDSETPPGTPRTFPAVPEFLSST